MWIALHFPVRQWIAGQDDFEQLAQARFTASHRSDDGGKRIKVGILITTSRLADATLAAGCCLLTCVSALSCRERLCSLGMNRTIAAGAKSTRVLRLFDARDSDVICYTTQ